MDRPELGKKHTCVGCAARFYDLGRPLALCPKCGVQQPVEKPHVVRHSRSTLENRRMARNPEPVPADEDVAVAEVEDVEDAEDAEDDGIDAVDDSDDDVEREAGVVRPVD